MLKDTQHLDLAQILDLLEGRTPNAQRTAALNHVEVCARCSDSYHGAEELLALMRTDDSIDAPRDVMAMAVNLFRNRQKQPGLVRRLVALLSFDSLTQAPAFGVRSAASSSRQLIYAAEEAELDLRVKEDNGRWLLSGQLLGIDECNGGSVDIVGGNVSASAVLNDMCEFSLPPLPSGDYKLTLRLSDVEVEVSDLELRT